MNSPIKTNQLKLDIDYAAFDKQFDVFQVTTSEKYFKHGANILDVPLLEDRVRAVRFSKGGSFYVLMACQEGNFDTLKMALSKSEDYDKITISKKKCMELDADITVQLLLNGTASVQSPFLRFNNLTGQLYCFHPQWLKHGKHKGQDTVMKVPALKIHVTPQMRMEITVCTFTSVLLKNRITFNKKRKFEDYPQYVFSVKNTLRRKLEQDTDIGYIQRQTDNERTEIPFIDFQNLERFEQSKMGIVLRVMTAFNTRYAGIANICFEEIVSYTALDYDRSISKEDKQTVRNALSEASIRIVDTIGDEYSAAFCRKVSELFATRYGISVPIGKRVSKGHLNVRVIHNKTYYEGGHDPHDDIMPGMAVQHITLEDFADKCESAITTIVHELLIKQDLQNRRISLFNWEALGYQHGWSFGMASEGDPKRYFFMTIQPNGSFTIKEQTLNLFEQSEYDDCVAIFENEKLSVEQVRGVIRDGDGRINVIRDTGWITIPQIDQICEQLNRGNTYLRSKKVRDEVLSACLDIKYIPDSDCCGYYFVGTIGNGMRANVARASNIRKIESYCDAPLFFDQLLPLMNVSFVRNGQLTILPFPFKYLREYIIQFA